MAVWRIALSKGTRLAVGPAEEGPVALLPEGTSIDALLTGEYDFTSYRNLQTEPLVDEARPVAPLEGQEVWASGVTFEDSRYARELESSLPDLYREVYHADRPELFFKATPGTAVGPNEAVGLRADSAWNVPEPELGLVVDAKGRIVAFTIGNDVSSRSIEGENALYLPQAKVYDWSCAVGPCLVPLDEAPALEDMVIEMEITRDGVDLYRGKASLSQLKRSPEELVRWLFAARSFPQGVLLLSGTGIVPPSKFTLQSGDLVSVRATGLGILVNSAQTVGVSASESVIGP